MSDKPDFIRSSSPSFGRRREGQTITRVEWNDVIIAGGNQAYLDATDYSLYNFTLDSIHIWTDAKGPQRYELDLQISGAWVRYVTAVYEQYKMLSLVHVLGPGVQNVTSWRDYLYNDNWLDRNFSIVRHMIINEV